MTAVIEAPHTGNQTPQYLIAPNPESGYTAYDAEDAVTYASFYGLTADPWQATTCEAWMRRDISTGRWLAGTWAITVSRQNGKNGILEIFELYAMTQLGLKILHTAHEVKTARKAFIRLKHFFGEKRDDPSAKHPHLNALVHEVRNTNGQEAIVLKNGGSVEFIARSKGSGRGFTVDVLVLDEAQDLQDTELEALKPTTSAAPKGDPLTIYMGTPPKIAGVVGEPFARVRDNAHQRKSDRISWVEFGAKGDLDSMNLAELEIFVRNPQNWADANPAWGTRIVEQTILDELNDFSAHSFARERLNMWPSEGGVSAAIQLKAWQQLQLQLDGRGENPTFEEFETWPVLAYGLDMNPQRTKVTIAVSVDAPDLGPIHLEVAIDTPFDEQGTTALVQWLWDRAKRRIPVVIDSFSPAKTLEPHLKRKKMKVYLLNASEFMQACGNLYDAVMKDRSITHGGQEHLDESIKGTYKEFIGNPEQGLFKWNRISLDVDLGPIIAVTCAYFGAIKFARRQTTADSNASRSAIVF